MVVTMVSDPAATERAVEGTLVDLSDDALRDLTVQAIQLAATHPSTPHLERVAACWHACRLRRRGIWTKAWELASLSVPAHRLGLVEQAA